jgi:hypothetical protein
LVRAIYTRETCALWIKNEGYQWSLISEGNQPKEVDAFTQPIPELAPGRYSITWYDPQAGKFSKKKTETEVKGDGVLLLSVPSFLTDLACLVTRLP